MFLKAETRRRLVGRAGGKSSRRLTRMEADFLADISPPGMTGRAGGWIMDKEFGKVKPIITPGEWLNRDSLPPEAAGCSLAVIGFCKFHEMRDKLGAMQLSESLFSHLDASHQFIAQVADQKILALECLYGGPMTATVIEELAFYRIKEIIGYGYAGSLTNTIHPGELVLAEVALVSDGTGGEYLPRVDLVYPDEALIHLFRKTASEANIALRGVKIWTTDALYREYPDKIVKWRQATADLVNMDTSHFYAVSRITGLAAVYLGVVSDCVEGPIWEDGFAHAKRAMGDLQDLIIEVIKTRRKKAH